MNPDAIAELYAAVARQALKDHAAGYHNPRHMRSGRWLQLAGLMTSDGEIDTRGISQRQPKEERLMTYTIHPESKLGRLQVAIATAQAAFQAAQERLAPLQQEATEIERWEQAAGLETDAKVGAAKHFRRTVLLANEMGRVRDEMTSQRHILTELEKQYQPLGEVYDRHREQLMQMQDPTSNLARLTPPYQLDRQRRDLEQWMRQWTQPEAPTEDVLTLQEA